MSRVNVDRRTSPAGGGQIGGEARRHPSPQRLAEDHDPPGIDMPFCRYKLPDRLRIGGESGFTGAPRVVAEATVIETDHLCAQFHEKTKYLGAIRAVAGVAAEIENNRPLGKPMPNRVISPSFAIGDNMPAIELCVVGGLEADRLGACSRNRGRMVV